MKQYTCGKLYPEKLCDDYDYVLLDRKMVVMPDKLNVAGCMFLKFTDISPLEVSSIPIDISRLYH